MPRLERRIGPLTQVHSDSAIVDFHPDQLAGHQRVPHVDPVPIFGLVYLNREEVAAHSSSAGAAMAGWTRPHRTISRKPRWVQLAGRIEPAFNRLAIYPGFVPHSGEIAGDLVRSDERFTSPRLTQRLLFG